jgi:hypothetical protein
MTVTLVRRSGYDIEFWLLSQLLVSDILLTQCQVHTPVCLPTLANVKRRLGEKPRSQNSIVHLREILRF